MKKKFIFENLINIILYSFVFISALYFPSDPDLGWHLKYGEYFFKAHEILRVNSFSSLMPDYRWNNSSWLTDLISYQTFNSFDFLGLSILGALVVVGTFFFISRAVKLSIFEKSIVFPILVYFTSPVNSVSFRGQLLSLFLISVIYYVLSIYEKNKKAVLILIPIFLVWGNLHGQYLAGLGLFIFWVVIYLAKESYLDYKKDVRRLFKDNVYLISSLMLSLLAILVNPFGFGVYLEAINHLEDPMQKGITEYLAPIDYSAEWWHLLFSSMFMVVGVMLLGTGKKNLDKAPFYIPSFLLLFFTFWVKRYAWIFYYSSVFLLQPVVHFFEPEKKKHSLIASFCISTAFLILAVYVKNPTQTLGNMNWDKYCSHTANCSSEASEFIIKNNLNNEKLLTIYDYGGFLIWNYPEIKPTIDGRMHLWRDEKGFSAFEYYYPIEQNLDGRDIDKTSYDIVFTSRKKPIFNRLVALSEEGKWRVVYADDNSAVFVRNK